MSSAIIDGLRTQAQQFEAEIRDAETKLAVNAPTRASVEEALIDQLDENAAAQVDRIVEAISSNYSTNGVALTGFLGLLNRKLHAQFGSPRKNTIDNQLEAAKNAAPAEPPSDEEITALNKQWEDARNGLAALVALRDVIDGASDDPYLAGLEVPRKRRGGARGPRGPRIKGLNFVANGTEYTSAGKLGMAFKLKAADVLEAIKSAVADFDVENPPEKPFTFSLSHGDEVVSVTGHRKVEVLDDDDDDDDDEDIDD